MARETGPTPREGEPLLTRLLRRRAEEPSVQEASAGPSGAAGAADHPPAGAPLSDEPIAATAEESLPPSRIDPDSGRPIDELVDADLPSIESIGPDSDVRAFLGRNISPELRRQALRKLFHQPKFNVVCLCAEYAENYNNFTPMGAIVPHDMKRQLAVQAERLARKVLDAEATATADAGTGSATAQEASARGAGDVNPREGDAASTKVLSDAATPSPDAPQAAVDKPQRG